MRSLLRFAVGRLLSVVTVVLAVTIITFVVLHVLRPEVWSFDTRPIYTQLGDYLNRAFLHYDFGISWDKQGRPVAELMKAGIPADLSLVLGALVIGPLAGSFAGAYCATHRGRILSRA